MKLATVDSATGVVYDTKAAAEYVGVKKETISYHLYVSQDLQPSFYIGRSPAFTRENLDNFMANKRGQGRPKSKV
jgi:hypothetical protein